jgi:zinc transport system substrate-binding protein
MRDALAAADPAGREGYSRGFEGLAGDVERAARRVAEILAPHRGKAFYVFHPSWGYFAREFGLRQVAVEVEGKEPTARRLAELVERARADGVRAVFAPANVSASGARAFAREAGASLVTIDDLAVDYVENLVRVAEAIAASLE